MYFTCACRVFMGKTKVRICKLITHICIYHMQVNNNGDITFDAPLSQYTSQAFPISGSHKIIAPFWTDLDTRKGGLLYYRTTTQNADLLRGTNKIRSLFPNIINFSASWMMVVTWDDVAAFGCSSSDTITCQQVHTAQHSKFSKENSMDYLKRYF